MRWRVVLGVVIIFIAVAVGAWAAPAQLMDRSVIQTGRVRISSSADGLTTVITVAAHQPTTDDEDVVDRAFRLQRLQPQHLAYENPASVTLTQNLLVVSVGEGQGWRFPVAGRPVIAGSTPTSIVEIPVRGLSHHWGVSIHRSHDEVVATLLAGVCSGTSGPGQCDPCQDGGPGSPGCGVQCGDDGCSTQCNPGWSACCNCPGICSCCPDRPSGAVKK